MVGRVVLALGLDPAICRPHLPADAAEAEITDLPDADTVLDLLWEEGEQVAAVMVPAARAGDPDTKTLIEVLERDWPSIAIVPVTQ